MILGYDEIVVTTKNLYDLLSLLKQHHCYVFHFETIAPETYRFYLPIYQRYKTKKLHLPIHRSLGIFHYLLFLFSFRYLTITVTFLLTLFLLPHFIFDITISGNDHQLNQELASFLNREGIHPFQRLQTYQQLDTLYEKIKDHYIDDIDYLNVYQNGSVFHVQYTNVVSSLETQESYHNIVAKKDCVIQHIDVGQGNILVRVNDYVKKGDVLISHTLETTSGESLLIPTSGVIHGYTFHYYTSSLKNEKQDQGDAFSYLLMKTRSQIPTNVKIDKEKVLSYDIIGDRIVLKMYYVFIEKVSMKEK